VAFRQGSALDMPFGDASFDLATLIHVGMNIADKHRLMAEAARVLPSGGHLVTTVDKDLAHGLLRRTGADAADRVAAVAARHHLHLVGQESFSGRSTWGSASDGDPVFPLAAYRRA